jgi:hypothetical protein
MPRRASRGGSLLADISPGSVLRQPHGRTTVRQVLGCCISLLPGSSHEPNPELRAGRTCHYRHLSAAARPSS